MKAIIAILIAAFLLFSIASAFSGTHTFEFTANLAECPNGQYAAAGKFPYDGNGVFDKASSEINLKGTLTCGYPNSTVQYCMVVEGKFSKPDRYSARAYLYDVETCSNLIKTERIPGTYTEDSSGNSIVTGKSFRAEGTHSFI